METEKKPDISENHADKENTITCGEILNISAIHDFYNEMIEKIKPGSSVHVDISKINNIDSTGVQLLFAISLEAKNQNIELKWLGRSEALKTSSQQLGLAGLLSINT